MTRPALVGVLLVAGLLGSAPAAHADRLEYFLGKLESAGFKVRLQAAFILGRFRDSRALPGLAKALTDPHYAVRAAAALSLGKIGDTRATDALLNSLGDPEPWVRAEAVAALGRVKARRALSKIVERLGDDDWKVKLESARALGRLGEAAAVGPLAAVVEQGETGDEVTAAARRSLRELAPTIKVEEVLRQLKAAPDKRLRAQAAVILGTIGAKSALPSLIEGLSDKVSYVRGFCALALANIGDPQGLGPLQALAQRESDQRVRRIAELSVAYLKRRLKK